MLQDFEFFGREFAVYWKMHCPTAVPINFRTISKCMKRKEEESLMPCSKSSNYKNMKNSYLQMTALLPKKLLENGFLVWQELEKNSLMILENENWDLLGSLMQLLSFNRKKSK